MTQDETSDGNRIRKETRFEIGDWANCETCDSDEIYAIHEGRGDHAPLDALKFRCRSCGSVRLYSGSDVRIHSDDDSSD